VCYNLSACLREEKMEELDIIELLYAIKNKVKYIIITVVIFAMLGLIYSKFLVTPMYKSSTTFVLSKSKESSTQSETSSSSTEAITQSDISLNSKLVSTYSEIIKSKTIAKEVIDSLGLDMSISEFKSNISVTSKDDTELIEITVSNSDPKLSADIANSLAEVFREKVNEIYKIDNLSVIDIAEPESTPYNIGTVKNIILFALVGLVISCGAIFVIVYFDDTIKDEKDVEALLNVPVIASIPKLEENDEGGIFKWKKVR
jgi:capsular polysaccharide biosynthesis protein